MSRRCFILLLVAMAMAAGIAPAPVPGDEPNEYKVKAAFVLKFIQFVEWPQDASQKSIVVATVGKDPFEGALEQIVGGKQVGGKTIVVKHFGSGSEVEKCQVMFVASESEGELGKTLRKQGPGGLLTVGESDQFLSDGGVIRFYTQGGTLRFEISQEAAAKAQVQISAKLLRLAKPR